MLGRKKGIKLLKRSEAICKAILRVLLASSMGSRVISLLDGCVGCPEVNLLKGVHARCGIRTNFYASKVDNGQAEGVAEVRINYFNFEADKVVEEDRHVQSLLLQA